MYTFQLLDSYLRTHMKCFLHITSLRHWPVHFCYFEYFGSCILLYVFVTVIISLSKIQLNSEYICNRIIMPVSVCLCQLHTRSIFLRGGYTFSIAVISIPLYLSCRLSGYVKSIRFLMVRLSGDGFCDYKLYVDFKGTELMANKRKPLLTAEHFYNI